jgi:hypothetical protein
MMMRKRRESVWGGNWLMLSNCTKSYHILDCSEERTKDRGSSPSANVACQQKPLKEGGGIYW